MPITLRRTRAFFLANGGDHFEHLILAVGMLEMIAQVSPRCTDASKRALRHNACIRPLGGAE